MEGSILYITLIQGMGIKNSTETLPEAYAVIELKNDSLTETQQVLKSLPKSGEHPVWGEKFVFDIFNPQTPLTLTLYNKEATKEDTLIGTCEIYLNKEDEMFKQQKEFTDEFELVSKHINSPGKIQCSLCWIFSKVRLHEDYKHGLQNNKRTVVQEKDELKLILQLLKGGSFINAQSGFGYTLSAKLVEIEKFKEKVATFIDFKTNELADKYYPNHKVNWEELCKNVLLIYMAISAFVMFYRSDFANMLVSACLVMLLYCDKVTFYNLFNPILYSLIATMLLDLAWMLAFTTDWIGRVKNDGGNEGVIRYLVLFCSFISFFGRIIVIAFVWKARIVQQSSPFEISASQKKAVGSPTQPEFANPAMMRKIMNNSKEPNKGYSPFDARI